LKGKNPYETTLEMYDRIKSYVSIKIKRNNFFLTEGACLRPTKKGMFEYYPSNFILTIYTGNEKD